MKDLKLPHEEPGPSEAQLEIKDIAEQSRCQKLFYMRITR